MADPRYRAEVSDPAAIAAIMEAAGMTGEATGLVISVPTDHRPTPVCACGCGTETAGGTWAPGHDATHKSALYRVVREGDDAEAEAARAELVERGWPLPTEKPPAEPKSVTPAKDAPKAQRQRKSKADKAREAAAAAA